WERKIAALQEHAPGLEGYRFEEPVPGVQDDWLAILRFDSEANLQAWMDSPARKKLVEESAALTEEYHTRIVRTGFEQWFQVEAGHAGPPAAWKQNMLVLMLLYPVVFLFSHFVHGPILEGRLQLPFWLALFIGNAVSVLILSRVVPLVSGRLGWWLHPAAGATRATLLGLLLVVAVYALCLAVFSQL
ncbi:MAG: antibiotic biosynthesis monooxygenase, partial [Rhizobiales bacterium]|nr:antibiotic biosynthesis monooxygenase [Hyphomicrobiales bacterium]